MPTITETLTTSSSTTTDPYLLSEEEMLEIIRQGEEDYLLGRCKTFNSAEDIIAYFEDK